MQYSEKSFALTRVDLDSEQVGHNISLESWMMPKTLEETLTRLLLFYCTPTFRENLVPDGYDVHKSTFADNGALLPKHISLPSVSDYNSLRMYWNQNVEQEIVFSFVDFNILALDKLHLEQLMKEPIFDNSNNSSGLPLSLTNNPYDFMMDFYIRGSKLILPCLKLLGSILKTNTILGRTEHVIACSTTVVTIIHDLKKRMNQKKNGRS